MVDELEGVELDPPSEVWATHLPGREFVPAYLVSGFAAQYRVIVGVLLAEQDSSLTGLSFDEITAAVRGHLAQRLDEEVVHALLAPEHMHLDARLEQLERWRVVTRWQEPARTGEDFLRRRDRYQLTPLAARLHAFWSRVDDTEEDVADLTLAPRAIHDRLVAFAEALRRPHFPTAAAEFQQVIAVHQAMARSARIWQRTLAHALSGGPDPAKQEMLWRTLQAYIGMWGEQVDVHSSPIAALIAELSEELKPATWRACVRAALADDAEDAVVVGQAERWQRTWEALAAWFSGAGGQARRLRRQLRDLVAPWARNTQILMDTGGALTRRAELLTLASAIERAPDDTAAWRIWDTAVGVFSARHLLLPSDAADEHTLPWTAAPPAPVTARFREQGRNAAVGRRTKIADYGAGRAAARRARSAALAARGAAEVSLRQRSGSRLATWNDVTEAEVDLLLELITTVSRGNAGASAGTPRASVTADGRWRVSLEPPTRLDDTTTLRTPTGRLATVNWRFTMENA